MKQISFSPSNSTKLQFYNIINALMSQSPIFAVWMSRLIPLLSAVSEAMQQPEVRLKQEGVSLPDDRQVGVRAYGKISVWVYIKRLRDRVQQSQPGQLLIGLLLAAGVTEAQHFICLAEGGEKTNEGICSSSTLHSFFVWCCNIFSISSHGPGGEREWLCLWAPDHG